MIGGTIIPIRNGAVSRNKSICADCLSVLRNMPPTTAPPLKYIYPSLDVHAYFSRAMPCGLKLTLVVVASVGSRDVAVLAERAEAGGFSTYLATQLSRQAYVDALCR